ncbi:MAG: hypothetical protein V4673_01325 [Pseudomonadota bacterium]
MDNTCCGNGPKPDPDVIDWVAIDPVAIDPAMIHATQCSMSLR